MQFNYQSYLKLLSLLKENAYSFADYHNWSEKQRCVILRHDIDNSPEKALEMAMLEYSEGVQSTYFVLLTSDFYNIFSKRTIECLRTIRKYRHEVGIHFDETQYEIANTEEYAFLIKMEASILSEAIGVPITTVSMHRPSENTLETNLEIPGMVNSYSRLFFKEFKYLSDSRRHWREPVEEIVRSNQYERLHILTHAFWYSKQEQSIHDTVYRYVNSANMERYLTYKNNISDMDSIMMKGEVLCIK